MNGPRRKTHQLSRPTDDIEGAGCRRHAAHARGHPASSSSLCRESAVETGPQWQELPQWLAARSLVIVQFGAELDQGEWISIRGANELSHDRRSDATLIRSYDPNRGLCRDSSKMELGEASKIEVLRLAPVVQQPRSQRRQRRAAGVVNNKAWAELLSIHCKSSMMQRIGRSSALADSSPSVRGTDRKRFDTTLCSQSESRDRAHQLAGRRAIQFVQSTASTDRTDRRTARVSLTEPREREYGHGVSLNPGRSTAPTFRPQVLPRRVLRRPVRREHLPLPARGPAVHGLARTTPANNSADTTRVIPVSKTGLSDHSARCKCLASDARRLIDAPSSIAVRTQGRTNEQDPNEGKCPK